MWKQILDLGKQLFSLTRKVQQQETDVKALQQEMKDVRQELKALTQAVQQMQFEQRHDRDIAARDHEILLLRLENYLLRSERGLPSGTPESLLQNPPQAEE